MLNAPRLRYCAFNYICIWNFFRIIYHPYMRYFFIIRFHNVLLLTSYNDQRKIVLNIVVVVCVGVYAFRYTYSFFFTFTIFPCKMQIKQECSEEQPFYNHFHVIFSVFVFEKHFSSLLSIWKSDSSSRSIFKLNNAI